MARTRAVILLHMGDEYYLMLDGKGAVQGFGSLAAATGFFERRYQRAHRQGYESSMSAVIHGISFNPSAVSVKGMAEVKALVKFDEEGKFTTVAIRNVSGFMEGIVCDPEKARIAHEAGTKPRLIQEGV